MCEIMLNLYNFVSCIFIKCDLLDYLLFYKLLFVLKYRIFILVCKFLFIEEFIWLFSKEKGKGGRGIEREV